MRPEALVLALTLLAAGASAEPFKREDWIYVNDAAHPDRFGINHWGLESFPLAFRAAQRGLRELENHRWDNWRDESTAEKPWKGRGMRALATVVDFPLFFALQNFDHQMGHDTRARELSRDYPGTYNFVSRRFSQTLPVIFGGKELSNAESATGSFNGGDASALINSTLWEMRNQFVLDLEKKAMPADGVNVTQFENIILHRIGGLHFDYKELDQSCVAAYGANQRPQQCNVQNGSAQDWVNYLMDVNTGRYGVTQASDYKLKISDLRQASLLQAVDPVFLLSLYTYGVEYVGHGRNTAKMPMVPLGGGVGYLPGIRVDLSPFGIEYIQDNFLRYESTVVDLFWTRGDNHYEKRVGGGVDAVGIPLFGGWTGQLFGELSKQPLTRVGVRGAIPAGEMGITHNVWNAAAGVRGPILSFGADKTDPKQVLLTLKVGRKNTGWLPGEAISGGTYVETGLGLRL